MGYSQLNRNNSALIKHGVIAVHDTYHNIIADASPVVVGGIASHLPDNFRDHLNVVKVETYHGIPNKINLHDFNALRYVGQFAPNKIGIHVAGCGTSLFGLIDGFVVLHRESDVDLAAVYLSYMSASTSFWAIVVKTLATRGTMFCAHTKRQKDAMGGPEYQIGYPGGFNTYSDTPDLMIAIPISENGSPRGHYDPKTIGCVGVIASAESWATPLLSSAVALTKILRPDLDNAEIREILVNTATDNGNGPRILDMKAAADHILTKSTKPSDPTVTTPPQLVSTTTVRMYNDGSTDVERS